MASLPPFKLSLYAAPSSEQLCDGPLFEVGHLQLRTIRLQTGVQPPPYSLSFEQMQARLGQCSRIYVESDGAFLWNGSDQRTGEIWQMAGMLYDSAGHLQRIELQGACPLAIWRQGLTMLDWPTQPLIIQLLEHGLMMVPIEFEKLWQQ